MIYNNRLILKNNTIKSNTPYMNYSGYNVLTLQSREISSIDHSINRILIEFDDVYIPLSDSIEKQQLICTLANGDVLTSKDIDISCHPITKEWEEGLYYQTIMASNWIKADDDTDWDTPGGDFSESKAQSVVNHKHLDQLCIDITELERNQGLLLKFEDQTKSIGSINYFSMTTNTVYSPYIRTYMDDFYYDPINTQSYTLLNDPFYLNIKNFKGQYKRNQIVKFRFTLVPQHIEETWENYIYKEYLYVLSESNTLFYRLLDVTEYQHMQVIPFDEQYTRISYNQIDGMYFLFHMDQLYPNREYMFQFNLKKENQLFRYSNNYRFRLRP